MEAYRLALKNYANFTGSTGLKQFWSFVLVNVIAAAILSIVPPLAAVYGLAVLVPTVAATVRRLNDAGYSPWFALLALVPVIGAIALIVMCAQPSASANAKSASGFADISDSAFTQDNVSVQHKSSSQSNASADNANNNQTTNV